MTLGVILITYLWLTFFLSNVANFWDMFRGKEEFIVEDTIAPASPYLTPISPATQEDTIDVFGVAEPNTRVVLLVNRASNMETISSPDGTFSFSDIKVGIFDQEIYAVAEDEVGNQSSPSIKYTVVKDTESPELEIIKPGNGEKHKSTGHGYKVLGQTEPGAVVFVNEQLALVSLDGSFSASIRLERGSNEIKVVAKDAAENETEEKVYIEFEKIE